MAQWNDIFEGIRLVLGIVRTRLPYRSANAHHNVQSEGSRILGFPGTVSARMMARDCLTCDIDRKEVYEHNETHCRNYRDFADRGPDRIFCEGERRRIWWRIFRRFKGHGRPWEHGQPWVTHL